MTRPQIITLELEDCSEDLVEYVENLERAAKYESDLAEQAIQSRTELAAQVEQLKGYIIALTHTDETGYAEDIGFVENFAEIQGEVTAIVAEVRAQVVDEVANRLNRDVFEAQVKNKGWNTDFITVNGGFYAYSDADIDNMWLGWCAALKGVKSNANQLRQQAKGVSNA